MKRIKVLNIMTGGMKREGITSTQLEFMRNMDLSDIQMDFLAVHNNENQVIHEFESYGCNVFITPDRKKELLKYILFLNSLIRKEKYHIVHVHGSSAIMAIELMVAKFNGVKARIAHSRNTMCLNQRLDRILRPFFYRSYNIALACGEDAGEWLFGKRTYTVVHNGKDLNKFEYDEQMRQKVRTQYNIGNKLAIGFVGKINQQKNNSFLVDIYKRVYEKNKDSVLYMMGDGPDREEIQNKIDNLGLHDNIILLGAINNVEEMLQGMDIMCLPSKYEGLPNVVLEWQIAGLPCLVSDTVTKECKVTDLVQFLPINMGTQIWADKILNTDFSANRKVVSDYACQRMKEETFDIHESVKMVKRIYFNSVGK